MSKTLVLIRHAHRDNSVRSKDNGLTDKGKNQARALKKYFASRFDRPGGVWLVSSPKKRCLETLGPISTAGNYEIDVNPDLDEQTSGETIQKFEGRVHHFLKEWQRMPQELTLVCSHGDWLPLAVFHLLGVRCDFKKGAWLELEWDGSAQLKWFIPTFKPFYE
jgi:broad specificity phosphatase PhoE